MYVNTRNKQNVIFEKTTFNNPSSLFRAVGAVQIATQVSIFIKVIYRSALRKATL